MQTAREVIKFTFTNSRQNLGAFGKLDWTQALMCSVHFLQCYLAGSMVRTHTTIFTPFLIAEVGKTIKLALKKKVPAEMVTPRKKKKNRKKVNLNGESFFFLGGKEKKNQILLTV